MRKKPVSKPKCLADDWKVVRPRPQPKPKKKAKGPVKPCVVGYPEMMTDWSVVRGRNLPKYAYYVEWENPDMLALHRLRVLGKKEHDGYPGFVVKYDKTLFADQGWERNEYTPSRAGRIFTRDSLCFTRLEVERRMRGMVHGHLNHVWEAARQIHNTLLEMTRMAGYFESMMQRMRGTWDMNDAIRSIPARAERV